MTNIRRLISSPAAVYGLIIVLGLSFVYLLSDHILGAVPAVIICAVLVVKGIARG